MVPGNGEGGAGRGRALRSEVMSELDTYPCCFRDTRRHQIALLVTSGPWTRLLCMRVRAETGLVAPSWC